MFGSIICPHDDDDVKKDERKLWKVRQNNIKTVNDNLEKVTFFTHLAIWGTVFHKASHNTKKM